MEGRGESGVGGGRDSKKKGAPVVDSHLMTWPLLSALDSPSQVQSL